MSFSCYFAYYCVIFNHVVVESNPLADAVLFNSEFDLLTFVFFLGGGEGLQKGSQRKPKLSQRRVSL